MPRSGYINPKSQPRGPVAGDMDEPVRVALAALRAERGIGMAKQARQLGVAFATLSMFVTRHARLGPTVALAIVNKEPSLDGVMRAWRDAWRDALADGRSRADPDAAPRAGRAGT
jgi:hypothetical protein